MDDVTNMDREHFDLLARFLWTGILAAPDSGPLPDEVHRVIWALLMLWLSESRTPSVLTKLCTEIPRTSVDKAGAREVTEKATAQIEMILAELEGRAPDAKTN